MMYPGSATGLCSASATPDKGVLVVTIDAPDLSFDKGVLVVTIDAPVDCPQAINVARNPYFYAKLQGDWIMKQLGGKGNVVLMNGQPGTTDTVAEHEAFLEAAKANPDVKITGDLYGMWTGAVAKSEMLKYLATHPQAVDAVWSTGNMGVGVGQALEQAGRPVTIVTDVTNQCSFLAFWKDHKFSSLTMAQDGGPTGYEAFVPATQSGRPNTRSSSVIITNCRAPVSPASPSGHRRYPHPSCSLASEAPKREHDLLSDWPIDHRTPTSDALLRAIDDRAEHPAVANGKDRHLRHGRLFRPVLPPAERRRGFDAHAVELGVAWPWTEPNQPHPKTGSDEFNCGKSEINAKLAGMSNPAPSECLSALSGSFRRCRGKGRENFFSRKSA